MLWLTNNIVNFWMTDYMNIIYNVFELWLKHIIFLYTQSFIYYLTSLLQTNKMTSTLLAC